MDCIWGLIALSIIPLVLAVRSPLGDIKVATRAPNAQDPTASIVATCDERGKKAITINPDMGILHSLGIIHSVGTTPSAGSIHSTFGRIVLDTLRKAGAIDTFSIAANYRGHPNNITKLLYGTIDEAAAMSTFNMGAAFMKTTDRVPESDGMDNIMAVSGECNTVGGSTATDLHREIALSAVITSPVDLFATSGTANAPMGRHGYLVNALEIRYGRTKQQIMLRHSTERKRVRDAHHRTEDSAITSDDLKDLHSPGYIRAFINYNVGHQSDGPEKLGPNDGMGYCHRATNAADHLRNFRRFPGDQAIVINSVATDELDAIRDIRDALQIEIIEMPMDVAGYLSPERIYVVDPGIALSEDIFGRMSIRVHVPCRTEAYADA